MSKKLGTAEEWGLNAPGGAGCSLTVYGLDKSTWWVTSLNAPDGAGCSLTPKDEIGDGNAPIQS